LLQRATASVSEGIFPGRLYAKISESVDIA
jgi:hypothetical protein